MIWKLKYPMAWIIAILVLGCIGACGQQGISNSNTKSQPLNNSRILWEEPVVYPQGQKIALKEMAPSKIIGDPRISFVKYENGKLYFEKISGIDRKDPYPHFLLYIDNKAPILLSQLTYDVYIPDGDHIIGLAVVDDNGSTLKYPTAYQSTMIRVKDGQVIKTGDAGVMLYYNQPRKVYELDETIILDFWVTYAPLDENYKLMSIIDNQSFEIETHKSYKISGLLPGKHMAELQLYRFGDIFNKPLNPSRMQFTINPKK